MAAKRHHSSHMHSEHPTHEARRHQEMLDGGMISQDHSAPSNLPREAMHKDYSNPGYAMPERMDDTIRGIDEQISGDSRKFHKHMKPRK